MGILYQTPAGSPLQFKVISNSLIEQKDFSSRDWRIIMKAALQAAGDYWIASYLPLRFQQYASSRWHLSGQEAYWHTIGQHRQPPRDRRSYRSRRSQD